MTSSLGGHSERPSTTHDRMMTALQEGRLTIADCTLAEFIDAVNTLGIHPTQVRILGTVGTTSAAVEVQKNEAEVSPPLSQINPPEA